MIFLKKIFFLLFFITFSIPSTSQQLFFTAFKDDASLNQNLLSAINKRYEKDIASLTGKNKKYIADIYKERFELIKENFKTSEIITAADPSNYLNAIASEILNNNPEYKSENLRILFSRSFYANATSMGEGSIFFNIGLFHRLQNESQVAFVLCHELAHYYLNHVNDNINQYVKTVYSDEFQQKLKNIQKLAYLQNNQLEAVATNLLFKNRRHSRAFEQAADSMALELMKNTNYDIREALTCLALLDSADKDKYNEDLILEKHFNFSLFPFKKSWIENDELVFNKGDDNETHNDSLKTHPDCAKRITDLKSKVVEYTKKNSKKFIVSESKFNSLKNQYDYEIINHCMKSNKISRALYYSLQLLQIIPDDPYLNTTVGQCLNQIYSSQKNHRLSEIIELPNPGHDKKYKLLLMMLQNLRLREIAALSYYFLQQREKEFVSFAPFTEAYNQSKQNFNQ